MQGSKNMAGRINFAFVTAILACTLVRYVVTGGCDDTAIGLQHRSTVMDARFSASSKYGASAPASNGRLNHTSGSSWCASSRDSTPYLQVDLGSVYIICGVATQGNSQADQWVRTYQVQYSTDGGSWKDYRENGLVKTFQGNYDRSTVVKRFLYDGVQARYIRVLPKLHYNRACLRLEFYGVTKQACSSSAVGIADSAKVRNHRFTASSVFSFFYLPYYARLNNQVKPGWSPTKDRIQNSWLKIDLGDAFIVCSIATQGSSKGKTQEYPKKYKLRLSMDNVTWQYYQENGADKVFIGNRNNINTEKNDFHQGSPAKLIELWPTDWNFFPTLRMELYGVTQGCRSSLGIEISGGVLNSQLTASSGNASDGRLYKPSTAWCSATRSKTEYLQVDLKKIVTLTGVSTQGHPTQQEWIKTFIIKYSFDNSEWFEFKDGESSVKTFNLVEGKLRTNWFKYQLVARYVRIHPQTWQKTPCLRFDVYGCDNVYSPKVSLQGATSITGSGTNSKVIVKLDCQARGQPTPNIKWTNGATDVTSQATLIAWSQGFTNSSLTFQIPLSQLTPQLGCQKQSQSYRLVRCSWQSYRCSASYPEIHGGARSFKQVTLSVDLNVPAAITNFRVSEVKARSVILSWNAPDPGHAQITSYNMKYWGAPNYKSINIQRKFNSFEVLRLAPYTDYRSTFILKAVSGLGGGQEARINPTFKTKEADPSRPQYVRPSSDPSVPRLTLHWGPPAVPNGVIRKYSLYYRYLPDGNVTIVTMKANTRSKTVNVIGGLAFNFSLSATTVKEGPKWSQLIPIPEYEPEAAPTNFKFRYVSASIYNCSWTPPPREKSHGRILSYDVKYSGKNLRRKKISLNDTVVNTNTSYAFLIDLKVCSIYEVSVRASTSKGPGPYSKATSFENAAVPPSDLVATEIDKTFVTIKWKEPASLQSLIQGFRVRYDGRKAYDKNFRHSEAVHIDSRFTTSKKITGLFPSTDYEFQVATKAGCNELIYTDKLMVATKIGNPLRPKIAKVSSITTADTAVTLTIAPSSTQNGKISFYQIIVLILDEVNQTVPKGFKFGESKNTKIDFYMAMEIPAENVTSKKNITIGDGKFYGHYRNAKLEEGRRYAIYFRAVSKLDKKTYIGEHSKMAEVFVEKAPPTKEPRQSTESSTVITVIAVVLAVLVVLLAATTVYLIWRMKRKNQQRGGTSPQPTADNHDPPPDYMELNIVTPQQEQSVYQSLQHNRCSTEKLKINEPLYENYADGSDPEESTASSCTDRIILSDSATVMDGVYENVNEN